MAKIIEINSTSLGNIEVGVYQWNLVDEPLVKKIYYNPEYAVAEIFFENSTKTLEVFDVNYVIRDEE